MVVLFMCMFFSLISGILANNKNRSIVVWAILGFVFGLFGAIVILILPKIEK